MNCRVSLRAYRPVLLRPPARCVVAPCSSYVEAGPKTEEPAYTHIDSNPLNKVIMQLFRRKMVAELGQDSEEHEYEAIIDLTRKLNSSDRTARQTQLATLRILKSLFPSWLPSLFRKMFAEPFPAFSYKMNAIVTSVSCQWLMGPNAVNDVEVDEGKMGTYQGVLVERCRYLEQASCASICINSCKVPTQEFFATEMGLNVTLEPNYEDFSCQFVFGKTPLPEDADDIMNSPCFTQCPSKRRHRTEATCGGVQPRAADETLAHVTNE